MLTLEELGEAIHMSRILILMAEVLCVKLAQERVAELLKTQKSLGLSALSEALFLVVYNILNHGDSKC